MSVVTGVTLHFEENYNTSVLTQINRWLATHNFGPLVPVERYFGGNKHPQINLCGAGYNYFTCEEEFIHFITKEIHWDHEENMVLIINPEEGPAKVYRVGDSNA